MFLSAWILVTTLKRFFLEVQIIPTHSTNQLGKQTMYRITITFITLISTDQVQ